MKKKLLPVAAVFLAALLATPCANGEQLKAVAGQYVVQLSFEKGKPVTGTNAIEITVVDAAGEAVSGAEVKIDYLMPSLPGKRPMMEYSTVAKPVGNGYQAVMNLTMKGEWKVILTITGLGGGTEQASFMFDLS